MEKEKSEPQPNYNEQFDKLPMGGYIKLPLSMVNSITIDDWKSPHTDGLMEVFKNKSGKIYIDDGNHRYFELIRKLRKENNYQEPDLSKVMVKVRKVYPINSWMLDY